LSADLLSPTRPNEPELLTGGIAYQLPAGQALPIYNGFRGELLTLVPPLKTDLAVTVMGTEGSWFRVRVGSGPCIEGFTDTALRLLGQNARPVPAAKPPRMRTSRGQVPWRIAQTPGPLLLVNAGTQLRFRGRIVATLRREGWARALSSLEEARGSAREQNEEAQVEVLAAVDDQVTVRGVVPAKSTTQVEESVFHLAPPPGPGCAAQLDSALTQSN
jgi:hypothetical protein